MPPATGPAGQGANFPRLPRGAALALQAAAPVKDLFVYDARRLPAAAVATIGAALALTSACAVAVEGDTEPSYGDVSLSVASFDERWIEVARDVRTAPGAELVGPLDRELHEPIVIDGAEVNDPSGLFTARGARIDDVTLTPIGDAVRATVVLRAQGPSLLAVRSAERSGAALTVAVDGGWFEIALAGRVSAASVDRILGTALVRLVRGEALLADDCRPDCLYDFGSTSWLCAPLRDLVADALGGECAGPLSPDEWAALVTELATEGARDRCDDLSTVPRPLCEWAWGRVADALFSTIGPDESGNVCAADVYDRCAGAAGE